jgi:hypothetical protein
MTEFSGAKLFGYEDQTEQPESQPKPEQKHSAARELLIWIQRWGKPVISLRDVRAFGPRTVRERPVALKQIEILVNHGRLVPMKAHRRDRLVWRLPPPGATILGSELSQ